MAIVKIKGVCGGEPIIEGTRLNVFAIIEMFYSGKYKIKDIFKYAKRANSSVRRTDIMDAINYSVRKVS